MGENMIFLLFAQIIFCFPTCTETIELNNSFVEKINISIDNNSTLCIRSSRYFYVVFNKFDNCTITIDYLSDNVEDYSLRTYTYDFKTFSPPFVDFSTKGGIASITSTTKTNVILHAFHLHEQCVGNFYVSNKRSDTVQMSTSGGVNQISENMHMCIFMVPTDMNSLHVSTIFPNDDYRLSLYNSTSFIKDFNTSSERYIITTPVFIIFSTSNQIHGESYFYLHSTSGSPLESTIAYGEFVEPFSGDFSEPLPLNIVVSVFPSVFVVIIAIIITYCMIKRRKKKLEEKQIQEDLQKNGSNINLLDENNLGENIQIDTMTQQTQYDEEEIHMEISDGDSSSFISVQAEIDDRPSFFANK